MSEWKDYIGNRKIKMHEDGFYIIKPADLEPTGVPIFCPICHRLMSSIYDDETYGKLGCCDSCAGTWAYKNMDAWKAGWRPAQEDVAKTLQMQEESL